jgi:GTP cyclohydrolase II
MFSYVDPKVKAELLATGRLVALDDAGRRVEGDAPDAVLSVLGPVPLPIVLEHGEATFRWYPFVRRSELARIEHVVDEVRANGPRQLFALLSDHMAVNSALVYGDFESATSPLVRVHSNCLTGDVFGSLRCDCGPQLHTALTTIAADGAGALIYMAGHEGRGIGLWAKAVTYLLQDAGHDTYEANERLGLPADSRDFGDAARVITWLRGGHPRIRLLGNNPLKREALESAGLLVTSQEPLIVGLSRYNARYLEAKRAHGHLIPPGPLAPKR